MSLGTEFVEVVLDLLADFGSQLTWRHVTSTENVETGEVTETSPPDVVFRGAVIDPLKLRLFSDTTVATATTAVLIPAGALTSDPKLGDAVALRAGRFLRVLEVKELLGPGDNDEPVLVAFAVAVGG